MGRLHYGRLSEAWKGEAADFTPLRVERLDQLGSALGVDLASAGQSEVPTTGGRRIDIVAQVDDGSEFVIENQYGRADHDHLTRGLAYAVARKARGLVVVAEEHRDEFRALAQYLNELAEHDPERGVAVWLVEAAAVRVDDSAWAPLFQAVVEPNDFTRVVEQTKRTEVLPSLEVFLGQYQSAELRRAAEDLIQQWTGSGRRWRLGPNHVVLEARGPATSGIRTVVTVYPNGQVLVPFSSYAGQNSGIPIQPLMTDDFRREADALFGFSGSERQARTSAGWLTPERVSLLLTFTLRVAAAYADATSAHHPTIESGDISDAVQLGDQGPTG